MSLPRMPRSRIQPKLRCMPRQKTEASTYLEMHKVTIEKQRLLNELDHLRQRYTQVISRLEEIDTQLNGLESTAEAYREQRPSLSPTLGDPTPSTRLIGQEILTRPVQTTNAQTAHQQARNSGFDSFTLEY
ncbi:hypothetical protein [Leptolyngbya sp. FACHB-261]|uniref:hypothetical protein n=1 Tax=Leptolyngbya sp. FACHB-261 TaxID=2692806 RepID=UPI001688C86A|nr:hypothetical protein [Leptolyngbya sp. FACHB-261]MBD2104266.1 hypothetical protein [Leptolyngbya sp. FACHB-261]